MKLGRSKEEFLQINGPQIATATHVVVLMTDAMTTSPFIFHEVLFADWLGKKLVTAMFKNVWTGMRFSLKAVLGRRSFGERGAPHSEHRFPAPSSKLCQI